MKQASLQDSVVTLGVSQKNYLKNNYVYDFFMISLWFHYDEIYDFYINHKFWYIYFVFFMFFNDDFYDCFMFLDDF